MSLALLIASRDADLQRLLEPHLSPLGIRVDVATTPLELVWRLTSDPQSVPAAVLVDARPGGFGLEALEWLRDDVWQTCLIVLAANDDAAVLARAELAEAAAVVAAPARPSEVLRTVRRVLRGSQPDEVWRWTPPRAMPRIAVPDRWRAMPAALA